MLIWFQHLNVRCSYFTAVCIIIDYNCHWLQVSPNRTCRAYYTNHIKCITIMNVHLLSWHFITYYHYPWSSIIINHHPIIMITIAMSILHRHQILPLATTIRADWLLLFKKDDDLQWLYLISIFHCHPLSRLLLQSIVIIHCHLLPSSKNGYQRLCHYPLSFLGIHYQVWVKMTEMIIH